MAAIAPKTRAIGLDSWAAPPVEVADAADEVAEPVDEVALALVLVRDALVESVEDAEAVREADAADVAEAEE